jgi:large subunit ribosomal protein L1
MSKRIKKAYSAYEKDKLFSLAEAFDLISAYKENGAVKFNESVDVDFLLGVDTNKSDQIIKSFVELPHGNGKKVRVLVFANDDNIDKALSAGAVYAGGDELISKVEKGEITDFDKCVATTAMMPKLAKIAKVLGPRGLMPNPKLGTVVNGDVSSVVSSLLKGRSDIKTGKDGSVKLSIGKLSFSKEQLIDNFKELVSVLKQLRPSAVKTNYFKGVVINTTMGIGVKIKMSEIYSI